jgi:hypothetical protein
MMPTTYLGVWNYYKFTTPKVKKFFFAPMTLNVVTNDRVISWSTNSLQTKKRFAISPVWLIKLGINLTCPKILKFEHTDFQLPKKKASRPLTSSTHRFLPSTSLEWTFYSTQTFILVPRSPKL